ncbi:hypothetical protein ACWD3J_44285 [Streptomyces sp. NPDC002755]|uniref:hypothetical protein n=1 Tax=Streptomyces sp. NPDC002884 TaxID=3154544 RepID=UPI0033284517
MASPHIEWDGRRSRVRSAERSPVFDPQCQHGIAKTDIVTTVAGQLLIPLAGDLARDDQRGRVVGGVR